MSQQKDNDYAEHYQSTEKNDAKALDKSAHKAIVVIVVHVTHSPQYRRKQSHEGQRSSTEWSVAVRSYQE